MNCGTERWLFLDGDDTLWDSQGLYDQVKAGFERIVQKEGLDSEIAVQLLDEIDSAKVPRMGYSLERFRSSLSEAYLALCVRAGRTPNPRTTGQLRRLLERIFKRKPPVLPGARGALTRLRRRFRLLLVTKGEVRRQTQLVSDLGLEKYFDRVVIVDGTHAKDYSGVISDLGVGPSDVWVIGNSPRSDINPALKLGLKCIWFAGRSWLFEEEAVSATVPVARSWKDVEELLAEET